MIAVDGKFHHHPYLAIVAASDVKQVTAKDISYGASWKARGGVGAFMMLARKWDRLENMLSEGWSYNIFQRIESEEHDRKLNGADGTALAEVRDLRRYLLLVEAEMIAQGHVMSPDVAALGSSGSETVSVRGAARPVEEFDRAAIESTPHGGGLLKKIHTAMSDALGWEDALLMKNDDGSYTLINNRREPPTPRPTPLDPSGDGSMRGPDEPAPVPAEDSNKHADRAVPAQYITRADWTKLQPAIASAYVQLAPETYGLPDFMSAKRRSTMPHGVQVLFKPVNDDWYALDREYVLEGIVGFRGRWRQDINFVTHKELPPAEQALYVRTDVNSGYQLRPELVEHWGRP